MRVPLMEQPALLQISVQFTVHEVIIKLGTTPTAMAC